ncbi:pachytene checkpoint protein 2 homolog [Cyclospora cayetanensis]|uniref:Pachytene checkpoint protein 2 homolog n=1 Tax=Cyclospora cayetanensis TaxID=88456 RepID=A0A6P6RQQ8_9EIME|nr:pachytene checkpoint protein 2 homolog [Cyclospora cayetanensis]
MEVAASAAERSQATLPNGTVQLGSEQRKIELCCEVQLNTAAQAELQVIHEAVTAWLASSGLTVALGRHDPQLLEIPLLERACSSIRIEQALHRSSMMQVQLPGDTRHKRSYTAFMGKCKTSLESNPVVLPYCQVHMTVLPYVLHVGAEEAGMPEAGDEGRAYAFNKWVLPNIEFESLWENLHFDEAIKEILLEYTSAALLFADKNVDPKLITWNRVLLLHGPPGSGKTSLCRALAQKLSIRLSQRFSSSLFLSINSPALFSRWFSESGKMVAKVFSEIRGMLQNKDCLVVVLIDEVESLSASRAAAASNEPSDSVRVVNALLTQIDMFSRFPNALVLTTSNLAGNCDAAFIDRADLKLYIPSPSPHCRRKILLDCTKELVSLKSSAPK